MSKTFKEMPRWNEYYTTAHFEVLILNRYKLLLLTSDNHFGFKNEHSTDLCIYALKQIDAYYVELGNPMYICFLDVSNAFDKVNHWILFSKLLEIKYQISLYIFY